jgi:hypothetical protein
MKKTILIKVKGCNQKVNESSNKLSKEIIVTLERMCENLITKLLYIRRKAEDARDI